MDLPSAAVALPPDRRRTRRRQGAASPGQALHDRLDDVEAIRRLHVDEFGVIEDVRHPAILSDAAGVRPQVDVSHRPGGRGWSDHRPGLIGMGKNRMGGGDVNLGAQLVPKGWRQWLIVAVSALVGWATWTVVVASQPRYSRVGNQWVETDESWPVRICLLLMGFAAVAGFVAYRCSGAAALALALPGVVLSPFTTPRGDEDGLWTLMLPLMVVVAGVMVLLAWGAAAVRVRADSRLSVAVPGAMGLGPIGTASASLLRWPDVDRLRRRRWTSRYDPPT